MRNPRASVGMLNVLLDEHPAGLQSTDSSGLSPLHWAVNEQVSQYNIDLIKALIERNRHSVERVCQKGLLPLHYACKHSKPKAEILQVTSSFLNRRYLINHNILSSC